MNRRCGRVGFIVLGLLSATLFGCLERKERVVVDRTGGVFVRTVWSGDSRAEVFDGDAPPSEGAGWKTSYAVTHNKKGDEEHTLTAERTFAPAEAMPAGYARPGDADADLCLAFPTTVTMEVRDDGLYYHFRRKYVGRAWASVQALYDAIVEPAVKDLKGKKPPEFTHDETVRVLSALTEFNTRKMLVFADAAFRAISPDKPQDAWLSVYDGVRALAGGVDYGALADMMRLAQDEDAVGAALAREGDAYEARAMETMKGILTDRCGYSGADIAAFTRIYEREKRRRAITEDLGDESFEISVEMPGEVVGSNADEVEGAVATWKFGAEMLRDRDVELVVTSRIAR